MRENRLKLMRTIRENEESSISELKRIMNDYLPTTPTTSGLLSILNIFEGLGLIKTKKEGRIRVSKLTKEGENILQLLEIVEEKTTLS